MSTEDGWPRRGPGLLSLTREKKQTTKRKAARCEGDWVCVGINESFDISKRLRHPTFPTQSSLSPDTTWQLWTSGSLRLFSLISGKKSREFLWQLQMKLRFIIFQGIRSSADEDGDAAVASLPIWMEMNQGTLAQTQHWQSHQRGYRTPLYSSWTDPVWSGAGNKGSYWNPIKPCLHRPAH